MAFIAAAMSFVAEGVRSVRVSSGASRLCRSSIVFLELDFFIVSFVLVDVLLARSNTLFLLRLFCCARRTTGSSNSIRLSVISISFGLFLLAYDLFDYHRLGDCAFAGFSGAKNEITPVPLFGIEREQSKPSPVPPQPPL
jgi:hypothetical protein